MRVKGGRLIGGYPSQRQKRRPVIPTKPTPKTTKPVAGQSGFAMPAPNPK